MRPAAEVDEVALAIERNHRVARQVANDLALVVLAQRFEQRDRFVTRHFAALQRDVLADQRFHPRFDLRQIVRSERTLEGEIVKEAIVDVRAYGDLRGRIELLDGHRQQVRARVAHQLQALRVALGNQRDAAIVGDDRGQIDKPVVYFGGQRTARQAGANRLGKRLRSERFGETTLRPIGQGNERHSTYSQSNR